MQISLAGNYLPVLPEPTAAKQHIAAIYHNTQETQGGPTYAYSELALISLWLIERHYYDKVDSLVQFMVANLAPLTHLIVESVQNTVPSSIMPFTVEPSALLQCSKCKHEGFAFLFSSSPSAMLYPVHFCWLCYNHVDDAFSTFVPPTSVLTVFPWHLFQ